MNTLKSAELNTATTFAELLTKRSQRHPDRVAIRFLADGLTVSEQITYGELHSRAMSIARWLTAHQATSGSVMLVFPQSIDYAVAFFGCLLAGATAVPAYPPRRNRNLDRLRSMAVDSCSPLALTTSEQLAQMRAWIDKDPDLSQRSWHAIDEIQDNPSLKLTFAPADSLAFLQYTSGSTGSPKGVMVSNANLMENQKLITEIFGQREDEAVVCGWLPMYHDMGLIGNLLHPIYLGGSLVLMSPFTFFQNPICWLKAITDHRATISGGPNFAYEMCADVISEEERSGLDLSSWNLAFNGAEPVRHKTVEKFAAAFKPHGFSPTSFSPCFGMAETTLIVSGTRRSEQSRTIQVSADELQQGSVKVTSVDSDHTSMALVSSGAPGTGLDVRVVDTETRMPVPDGMIGEVWVHGTSVAGGYWNRPELTADVFQARLADGDDGEKSFLRTGDLGFLREGQLFITGRLKDMIIVHGANHYPSDIEETVAASHDALSIGSGVAFSSEKDGSEQVFVAQELKRSEWRRFPKDEVLAAIFGRVFQDHGLALAGIILLRPGSIPKTTSGKLQRQMTRKMYEEEDLQVVTSWTTADGPLTEAKVDDTAEVSKGTRSEILSAEQHRQLSELQSWLIDQISKFLRTDTADISPTQPLSMYGLNSMSAVRLAGALSEHLGRDVDPTLAYNFPTISAIARHLVLGESGRKRLSQIGPSDEPVAIIGMACRFPRASNVDDYWRLLVGGTCAIGQGRGALPAGYLDDVDQFDFGFFGISPREADEMDPQQRLSLEVTWRALEHANISAQSLAGTRAGVFFGVSGSDYERLALAAGQPTTGHSATGVSHAIVANRISYFLDLQGPSLSIDTACSSSLVAVHQASEAIRRGECDLAIAGGVSLMLSEDVTEAFHAAGMLSPTGTCKTFAAGANGFVRGEGCGAIVLKRLSQAIADGDNITSVIRGSAINQDGRSNGLTAPNGLAQQEVLESALARAGVEPSEIDYVEAHGTGTELGDPVEIGALASVFTDRERPLQVGSAKTNIGHLEAAAGIAGLIKTCLAIENQLIPPHLHFDEPSPHIDWDQPIEVASDPAIWVSDESRIRRAGISSFGFGGTNAHVIVEEPDLGDDDVLETSERLVEKSQARSHHLITLSAKSPEALEDLIAEFATALPLCDASLSEVSASVNLGRSDFQHRLAVVARDVGELAARLRDGATGEGVCRTLTPENEEPAAADVAGIVAEIVTADSGSDIEPLMLKLGSAYVAGATIDWKTLHGPAAPRPVVVPGHPMYPQRCWFDAKQPPPAKASVSIDEVRLQSEQVHPLLGRRLNVGVDATIYVVNLASIDYLRDHCLQGVNVFPTTGYIEQAVVGARLLSDSGASKSRVADVIDLEIKRPLVIDARGDCWTQLVFQPVGDGYDCSVKTFRDESWETHATFGLRESSNIDECPAVCDERVAVSVVDHYTRCESVGLRYGPAFCGLKEIEIRDCYVVARAEIQDTETSDDYRLHPALLDACLQSLASLIPSDQDALWLPVGVERVSPAAKILPTNEATVVGHLRWDPIGDSFVGDVWIRDCDDHDLCKIQGLRLQRAQKTSSASLYETVWVPRTRERETTPAPKVSASSVVEKVNKTRAALLERTGLLETLEARGQLDELCRNWVIECLVSLLGPVSAGAEVAVDEIGVQPRKRRSFDRMLEMLVEDGVLVSDSGVWIAQVDLEHQDVSLRSNQLATQHAHLSAELNLLSRCGKHLSEVMVGEIEPLDLLFPPRGDTTAADVYKVSPGARTINAMLGEAVKEIGAQLADGRGLRVVEIGAGTGGTTRDVLANLPSNRYRYHFTDIGASFLAGARKTFAAYDGIEYQILDIERAGDAQDPIQSELTGSVDLIIAANVLHATKDLRETIRNVRSLLADGGQLLLLEGTRPVRWMDLTFGLTDGWWRFDDDVRSNYPLVSENAWVDLLKESHFSDAAVLNPLPKAKASEAENVVIVATADSPKRSDSGEHWIVVGDHKPRTQRLAKRLVRQGSSCEVIDIGEAIGEQLRRSFTDLPSKQHIVFVGPKTPSNANAAKFARGACKALMETVQSVIEFQLSEIELALVTSDADIDPTAASLRSMMRSIQLEQPNWRVRSIDLKATKERFARLAVQELACFDREPETKIDVTRDVRRLQHDSSSRLKDSGRVLRVGSGRSIDAVTLESVERRVPGSSEIEIAVLASGLNYRDVLIAMDMYPETVPLGAECVGRVTRVGASVSGFKPGDHVVGFAEETFADFVNVSADRVARLPKHLRYDEAATIPVAFLTASFSLEVLGKINKVRRVLIHSATGGVGLAAIQIAKAHGVEVFATSGRTKHAVLRELGIEHIFDSRSADFTSEIQRITGGEGVDVILGTQPESMFDANVACLSQGGVFVDITKPTVDLAQRMADLRPDATYHLFDLVDVLRQEPSRAMKRLRKLMSKFAEHIYRPLPFESYRLEQATDAMRQMQLARQIGKLVVVTEAAERLDRQNAVEFQHVDIRDDAAYVIFGGLGDLGLLTAEVLASQGARRICLVGRSKPSSQQRTQIDRMRSTGVEIIVSRADVSSRDEVASTLKEVRDRGHSIAGVIHSAGVLDDAFIQNQNADTLRTVMDVKAAGLWNLHELTREDPLDLFVVYSSMAAVVGAPGQTNHAASNAFMDALIAKRIQSGLPASTINWGPWAGLGEAARRGADQRSDIQGIGVVQPAAGADVIGRVLSRRSTAVAVADIAPEALPKRLAEHPLFEMIQSKDLAQSSSRGELISDLSQACESEREDMMYRYLSDVTAQTLGFPDTSRISHATILTDVGLDSLTALELKDVLESDLMVSLPASLVYDYPSVGQLSRFLLSVVTSSGSLADELKSDPKKLEKAAVEDLDGSADVDNNIDHETADAEKRAGSVLPMADEIHSSLDRLTAELSLWES